MSRTFMVPIVLPADPTAPLQAATKQYVDPGAWQTVTTFGSGWGAHATDQAPRYRLEGDIVRLDGSATRSSGTNTTIFTLPIGYRPSNIRRFWPAGGATASVRIAVQTSGTVDQTAGADFSRTSLEGCMFPIT